MRYCYFKNLKKATKNNEQTRNTNEEINFYKVFCSMSHVKHPAIKKGKWYEWNILLQVSQYDQYNTLYMVYVAYFHILKSFKLSPD